MPSRLAISIIANTLTSITLALISNSMPVFEDQTADKIVFGHMHPSRLLRWTFQDLAHLQKYHGYCHINPKIWP